MNISKNKNKPNQKNQPKQKQKQKQQWNEIYKQTISPNLRKQKTDRIYKKKQLKPFDRHQKNNVTVHFVKY